MSQVAIFVSGAICTLALMAALVFLRFFRRSRDRFFLYFALAFALHALARAAAALQLATDNDVLPYLSRLLAYVLIVAAIWSKNRQPRSDRRRGGDP